MNKLFILIFFFPIFIVGCNNKVIEDNKIIQSINTLNMNIFSNSGEKLLSIKSPYSRYDKANNTFVLKETTINLFKDNKLEYLINSDNAKLSNNNQLLELNGNVLVNTIIEQDDQLTANSFTWNIKSSEYLLVGNVRFENSLVTLSSNKAIFKKTNNIIKFFNPVKYKINGSNKENGYEINSENAFYNIKTKSVSFRSREDKVRSKIYF